MDLTLNKKLVVLAHVRRVALFQETSIEGSTRTLGRMYSCLQQLLNVVDCSFWLLRTLNQVSCRKLTKDYSITVRVEHCMNQC